MKLKWQIIILFQAAVEIFLGYEMTKFNVLPLKYLIVVYIVLFLIFRLMYKFIKPPKKIKKSTTRQVCLPSCFYCDDLFILHVD